MLSAAARGDLEQIWDYTVDRWDDEQAEKYVREIERAIERVVDNPGIGRVCDEVRPGYRKHEVGSHTSYYRIASGEPADSAVIDIVRILHQRMDVDRHLD